MGYLSRGYRVDRSLTATKTDTRLRDWVDLGSWDGRRITADFNQPVGGSAALRLLGMRESSDSFRDDFSLSRWGVNPNLSAYRSATDRTNLFNQTDLNVQFETGAIQHTLLVGAELGRQVTDNLRKTGYFAPGVTSWRVSIDQPNVRVPVEFLPSATDADNHGRARVAAFYVQDQIALTPSLDAILGLRYDRFSVDLHNNRNGVELDVTDTPVSPRAGLVYRPIKPLSLYASYSVAFQPRAGDQLSSLSASNRSLDPEEFRNREVGAKWDINRHLMATLAVYQLDRSNVAIPDPSDPTLSVLVDGQRVRGVELGLAGHITEAWQITGGYAYQDGEITHDLSANAHAGARLAQLPENTFSLWNRYDFSPRWGAAIGAIYRDAIFTSTDNKVTLPSYTRFDAALYFTINERSRLQVNVENLFDRDYYANAHGNNNISPGSPRAVRIGLDLRF